MVSPLDILVQRTWWLSPGTEMKISTATIYGLPSKMSPIGLLGPSGGTRFSLPGIPEPTQTPSQTVLENGEWLPQRTNMRQGDRSKLQPMEVDCISKRFPRRACFSFADKEENGSNAAG